MKTVIADFDKRVTEIDLFFRHLEAIEERDGRLSVVVGSKRRVKALDPELVKVLKANIFLLLYNLVESSIRQALAELLDRVSEDEITYSQASEHIKKVWLDAGHAKFKNKSTDDIFQSICQLPHDIVKLTFHKGIIDGGNLDRRKIRNLAQIYGFSDTVHRRANNGVKLFDVKKKRNDLAHGLVSFSECGRNYTISDLRQTKNEVIIFLRSILRNITQYLDSKQFRA